MAERARLEITLEPLDGSRHRVRPAFSAAWLGGALELPDRSPLPEVELPLDQLAGLAEQPAAYGRALSDALFGNPEILGFYRQVQGEVAARPGALLSLQIRAAPGAAAVHGIRWETLRDPGREAFLALDERVVLSRYLTSRDPRARRPTAWADMKALVLIANPAPRPGEQIDPVDVRTEYAIARAGLEGLPLAVLCSWPAGEAPPPEVVGPPTLDALVARLREGHDILYVAAHGRLDGDIARLWLEDGAGNADVVASAELPAPGGAAIPGLLNRLHDLPSLPALVVLASCHSAGEGAEWATENVHSALGPLLVAEGVPAVVAMAGAVPVPLLTAFIPALFDELQYDGQLDRAVAAARSAVAEEPAWWMPVLFTRSADGRLWTPPPSASPGPPARPFKFLASYTPGDRLIFHGRGKDTAAVLRLIDESPRVLLYGDPGVGVTSLLEAGIRPALETRGDLVLRIADYARADRDLRGELHAAGRELRARREAPLDELLASIGGAAPGRIVLMLDQFERALALPAARRERFLTGVRRACAARGDQLRLVIGMHEDARRGLAEAFPPEEEGRPALRFVELGRLTQEQALEVVERAPLIIPPYVRVDPATARKVAADLDGLYQGPPAGEGQGGRIEPGHLQIVCRWLYDRSLARNPQNPVIDTALYYGQGGGAGGILASYMAEELAGAFADQKEVVERALTFMAGADAAHWTPLPALAAGCGVEEAALAPLLDRLVAAEILARRAGAGGGPSYAFANSAAFAEARRLRGGEAALRDQAGDMLERIWRSWLALAVRNPDSDGSHEGQPGASAAAATSAPATARAPEAPPASDTALATPGQLRYLAGSWELVRATPPKGLLLLRSAVGAGEPSTWIPRLGCLEGLCQLVGDLEALPPFGPAELQSEQEDNAARVLRLSGLPRPRAAGDFGRVSWAAAARGDALTQETCALALAAVCTQMVGTPRAAPTRATTPVPGASGTPDAAASGAGSGVPAGAPGSDGFAADPAAVGALDPAEAAAGPTLAASGALLARLDAAVEAWEAGRFAGARRAWRRAGFRGMLADAGITAPAPGSDGWWDRGATWLWRFQRGAIRSRDEIIGIALGAALVGGLGLGLLAFLLAHFTNNLTPGLQLGILSTWGFLLTGAAALGVMSGPVFIAAGRPPGSPPASPGRRAAWVGAAVGTLVFTGVYLGIGSLTGQLDRRPWGAQMAGAALLGGALALGLATRPWEMRRLRPRDWLWRAGLAAVAAVAAQALLPGGAAGPGTPISSGGAAYQNAWAGWAQPGGRPALAALSKSIAALPGFAAGLGLLEAALIGVVMAVCAVAGARLGHRMIARWRAMVIAAGR